MMYLNSLKRLIIFSVFTTIFSLFLMSQSSIYAASWDDILGLVTKSDGSKEAYSEIIEKSKEASSVFSIKIDNLKKERDKLNAINGDYLVNTPTGIKAISNKEVEDLGAAIALQVLLHDVKKEDGIPLYKGNSELIRAMNNAIHNSLVVTDFGINKSALTTSFLEIALDGISSSNRKNINNKITEIDKSIEVAQLNINSLIRTTNQSEKIREQALSRSVNDGFINTPGMYVIKKSGSGWRKKYGGSAHKISGYHNFLIKITDSVTKPKSGSFYWSYPTGVDIKSQIEAWKKSNQESSKKWCKQKARTCVGDCPFPPDIWINGPEYEVIAGPFKSMSEAEKISGGIGNGNLNSKTNSHWKYDKNHKYDEAERACGNK